MIIPAILAKTEEEFREKLFHPEIAQIAKFYQIDILDGSLFGDSSWHNLAAIRTMENLPEFELHLMVKNPLPILESWHAAIPSFKRAIIHAEIERPLSPIIDKIKSLGLEASIALNPETSIEHHLNDIQHAGHVLMMGVHPGKSGQLFLGDTILHRIQNLKAHLNNLSIPISVDGGVNAQNAHKILQAGATNLCTSSAIWKADNPKEAFALFSRQLEQKN